MKDTRMPTAAGEPQAKVVVERIYRASLEELWAFRRGLPAEDDVTLVVVKVL